MSNRRSAYIDSSRALVVFGRTGGLGDDGCWRPAFRSNEADVIWELRAFGATLPNETGQVDFDGRCCRAFDQPRVGQTPVLITAE